MRAAGISPALIYAYEETGLIVTQENRRLIPDIELREFDAKVREYHDLGLGRRSDGALSPLGARILRARVVVLFWLPVAEELT